MTRPRTPAARYFKPTKDEKVDFSIKFKKTKDPAPGTYNVEECFRKTQWGNSVHTIGKGKLNTYVDIVVKKKKAIPGVGIYKEIEKGY